MTDRLPAQLMREGTPLSLRVLADYWEERGSPLAPVWRSGANLLELVEYALVGPPRSAREGLHRLGQKMADREVDRSYYFHYGPQGPCSGGRQHYFPKLMVVYTKKTFWMRIYLNGSTAFTGTLEFTRRVYQRDGLPYVRAKLIRWLKEKEKEMTS